MNKTWIIVADACRARILSTIGSTDINEVTDLVHGENHLLDQQRVSDKPGHNAGPDGSRHEVENRRGQNDAAMFAKEIANFLVEKFDDKSFQQLALVCEPKMLGHMRQQLPDRLKKQVSAEVDRDLVRSTAAEIRQHLPLHM